MRYVRFSLAVSVILATWAAMTAGAQTNDATTPPPAAQAQRVKSFMEATEKIRAECVQGRRTICGRIEKVLPDGLIVDSGYLSLLRPPLDKSWLLPGTVEARREPNLVEGKEPDGVCVGLVFLTDTPKSRLAQPKVLDFVVIHAYPAGRHTYATVGKLQRTVRHFSANLQTTVQINREAAGIQPPAFAPGRK